MSVAILTISLHPVPQPPNSLSAASIRMLLLDLHVVIFSVSSCIATLKLYVRKFSNLRLGFGRMLQLAASCTHIHFCGIL